MTDFVQAAIIVSIPATLTAVANLIVTVRHNGKVDAYKHEVNSRMDELLKMRGEAERAQGKAEGVEQERIRIPDKGDYRV